MKSKTQNTKHKIPSLFRKLVPGLVLLSFVLSGIFAPVSFSYKNYGSVETKTVLATNHDSSNLDPNAGEIKQPTVKTDPTGGTKTLKGSAQAYTQSNGKTAASPKTLDDSPFNCNILTEFAQCVGTTIYHLIFVPAAYVLTLSGWLFDITIAFTLSKNILDINFAKDGWVVTRDLANMFFIFILLYIAIATILEIAAYNAKALLARLIIVALLLNFSLFATRVVIDASNILALAFYNSITAPVRAGDIGEVSSLVKFFDVKPKGISSGLVSFFDPQKLLGSDQIGAKKIADFAKNSTGKLIFIYMFSAIIILVTAWAFFSVAFLFITRTAVLWFLMATAPIAFAAIILPKTRDIFTKWWGELMSKSFCVAVFLFFLWLITKFTERGIFQNLSDPSGKGLVGSLGGSSDNALLFTMIIILLQFSILLVLILVAKQQTQKMCGAVAGFSMNMVSGLGSKAAGFLAGGIGGRALRLGVGGLSNIAAEKMNEAKWGSKGIGARLALQAARKVAGASFDVRGTKLGKIGELGDAAGKGGYSGWQKGRIAKDITYAKSFGEGPVADEAREEFAKRIGNYGWFGRTITGRGILSKTVQEKSAKAINKMTIAGGKIRKEEEELKKMKGDIIEEITKPKSAESSRLILPDDIKDWPPAPPANPIEYKDTSGKKHAFLSIKEMDEAVQQGIMSKEDMEDLVDNAVKKHKVDIEVKLEKKNAELAGESAKGEKTRDISAITRLTKEISQLNKRAGAFKEITRLEERREKRYEKSTDKQERESSQKPSAGGDDKDKK